MISNMGNNNYIRRPNQFETAIINRINRFFDTEFMSDPNAPEAIIDEILNRVLAIIKQMTQSVIRQYIISPNTEMDDKIANIINNIITDSGGLGKIEVIRCYLEIQGEPGDIVQIAVGAIPDNFSIGDTLVADAGYNGEGSGGTIAQIIDYYNPPLNSVVIARIITTSGTLSEPLGDITNLRILAGDGRIILNWNDPNGVTWQGTMVRRKTTPWVLGDNHTTGMFIANITIRDRHALVGLIDDNLTNNTMYYYKLFPYNNNNRYINNSDNEINAMPIKPLIPPVVILITRQSGKLMLSFTHSVTETNIGTRIVYKEGSYPTSVNDGTIIDVLGDPKESCTTVIDSLTDGVVYYFALFAYDDILNYSGPTQCYDSPGILNGIANQYISIYFGPSSFIGAFTGGMSYSLGTIAGNPETDTDDNKRILFGWPYDSSSYATIQIDNINHIFAPTSVSQNGSTLISEIVYNDITVTQYIELVNNQYTGRKDTAEFRYVIANTGSQNHNIGIRIMFDTMLGSNDRAPFRVPGLGDVTTETDLFGSNIPEFWQAFDSLSSPEIVAQGTLRTDANSTPDRLRFSNFSAAFSDPWDYTSVPGTPNNDSAVCLYWNPKVLSPGQTMIRKTYLGLSVLQQDNTPPLAIALSAVSGLEANGGQYVPNPFTIIVYTHNISTNTISNVNITLSLPGDMNIISGTPSISLGTISADAQKQALWSVHVDPSNTNKIQTYDITITANGISPKVITKTITIPSIYI